MALESARPLEAEAIQAKPREDRPAPLVSVIVPTRNRRDLLREALESLMKQTLDPSLFEIVVVDNCSTDGTEELMAHLAASSPCRILYEMQATNGGCFRSFNRGVELASAEIVALTDSDVWAHPEWLERGLEAFSDEEVAFVAGFMDDKPTQAVTFFSLPNGAPQGENLFYPAGNCFYRRRVWQEMGGFRETLSFGDAVSWPVGCCDTDLAWRVRESGRRHVYRPDVVVYHEVAQVSPGDWLRWHARVFSIPFLMRLHPELRRVLRWRLFLLTENLFFYLAAGATLGAVVQPWALVLTAPHIVRSAVGGSKRFSPLRLPQMAGRVLFLTLRDAVICSCLIYGSIRARAVVL